MGWSEVLLIVVSFCGGWAGPGNIGRDQANECRHERIHCIKNGVALNPNGNNAEDIIDACLDNPKMFPEAKPAPKPSVSATPTVSASPSPSHS